MVTCSSQNIYPIPQVSWATDPPSAQEALENSTTKTTDHKGLFTVESMLRILGNVSNYTYFCSVISADKTQIWTASRKNQGAVWFHTNTDFMNRIIYDINVLKNVCKLFFRGYNTGRGLRSVHPMHRSSQSPEFFPHLDL